MSTEPNDYYNSGRIEMIRFGRHIIMKNNSSIKQQESLIKLLKKRYPLIKRRVDKKVNSIRKLVCKCDPLQLLSFSADLFLTSNLGISSEIQLSKNNIIDARMTEYLQSIFVSTPLKYKPTKKDPSRKFFHIKREIAKLNSLIDRFYLCWIASLDSIYPNCDEETRKAIAESQLLYTVRGQRYQSFEIEYYERLLKEHNDIFIELFHVSYQQVIDGIKKLQYALSQGKIAVFNDMNTAMDSYISNGDTNFERIEQEFPGLREKVLDQLFGTKLRNVIEVTGWPIEFVEYLSWDINECNDFYEDKAFAGWPIVDLPVQKRPFIKIKDQYYCFDYYSFMDNFYREIQKAISRKDPTYKWSDHQKDASENMVADVFKQILPGSEIYRDNYYPKNKSIKNLVENDIIVKYANKLIVVEVKAGSFVYTPPITDFNNHIASYKNLIEKADHQCKNTYDYLMSNCNAILYTQDGSPKAVIDMNNINDVFMVTVTMDNINDFAAKAEKLNFLQLKCNAISLSIDDLMVYRDYFESPLVFLHFLKQRRQATQEAKLALNDELDHLGMYIKHNMYCLELKEYPDNTNVVFHGYREDLDKYFCAQYHPQLNPEKPSLRIPYLFVQILTYLEKNNVEDKVDIADYFLNFASDAKEQLCDQIQYALQRQRQTGHMLAFSAAGEDELSLRYTVFVFQPKVEGLSYEYIREYVLSTMLWNEDDNRTLLEFTFDKHNQLISLKHHLCTRAEINDTEYEKLWRQGRDRASMRVKIYLKDNAHIENSDLCPCGSGRTYEKCCRGRLNQMITHFE